MRIKLVEAGVEDTKNLVNSSTDLSVRGVNADVMV